MKIKCLTVMIALFAMITGSAGANDSVTILTEEFPPFQYTEKGKIIGASAEIVEAIMTNAKVSYEMKSYPWARSYALAQEQPNTMIYSISRRPAREKLFKWAGIIVPSRYSVFSLKRRPKIKINVLDDMKKYRIGTTIEDAREAYLVGKGFDLDHFDRISGKSANAQNYMKLKHERIDLWPMPDAVAFYIAKEAGDDPTAVLHKVFPLEEISKGGYYLAANPDTDPVLFAKIKTALENFTTSDAYAAILNKWGIGN